MNKQEAKEHIENGGCVTSGGYFYTKHGYFAYGTYPACFRGGEINVENSKMQNWSPLTEKDIVCRVGYKPDEFYKPILNDGTVDFEDLWNFLKGYGLETDLSDSFKNATICIRYFKESK